MGYNHGKAMSIFNKEWEIIKQYYKEQGMTDEQIKKIYDYDYGVFCSDRCFNEHRIDISDEERNERFYVEEDLLQYDIDNWIQFLDEKLYRILKKFPEVQLRVFYLYRVEHYSQKEISSIVLKPQQTISRWIGEIADLLDKFEKNG